MASVRLAYFWSLPILHSARPKPRVLVSSQAISMTIEAELQLAHRFECEVLEEIPGGHAPRYWFPDSRVSGQDGLAVRVVPELGAAWIGTFAFGRFGAAGVTRVLGMPDPEKLCVVARGAGYIVPVATPEIWESIRAIPIIDVRVIIPPGIVVFANNTELLAYGRCGVIWRTVRLSWDGLRINTADARAITGEYWDIREDALRQFEVDVATGAARGGVEEV